MKKRILASLLSLVLVLSLAPVSAVAAGDPKTEFGITGENIEVTEISKENETSLSKEAWRRCWGTYLDLSEDPILGSIEYGRIFSACHIASAATGSPEYVTFSINTPTLDLEGTSGDSIDYPVSSWAVIARVDEEIVTYPTQKTSDNKLKCTVRLGSSGTDLALAGLLDSLPNYGLPGRGDWGTLTITPSKTIEYVEDLGYVRPYTLTYLMSEQMATTWGDSYYDTFGLDLIFNLRSRGLKIDTESMSFEENSKFELAPDKTGKTEDGTYKFTVSLTDDNVSVEDYKRAVGVSYAAPAADTLLFEGELHLKSPGAGPILEGDMLGCVPLALTVVAPPEGEDTYHKITVTQSKGGQISPRGVEGEVWVKDGESHTFTITPAEGYAIQSVTVDGKNVESTGGTYTFEQVSSNHTITAVFQQEELEKILIRPVELYKYLTTNDTPAAGEDHSNCFPEPRYEGIPENAVIKVGGTVWNPEEYHNESYPFTINYYEEDGAQIKDDHKPGTYVSKIEVLPGLKATMEQITINGKTLNCQPGKLHILTAAEADGIENIEELTSAITTTPPAAAVEDAVVVAGEGAVTFKVNNLDGQLPSENADIRLLQDELLSAPNGSEDYYVGLLRQRLEEEFTDLTSGSRQYAMKYLDFIDVHDSNLIMTASLDEESTFDLYLPYLNGVDKNSKFRVFNFWGLYRTYADDKDYGSGVVNAIKTCEAYEFTEIEKTPYGIKVTVRNSDLDHGRLGAMALTWQQGEHTITATAGTGGSISPSGAVSVRHTGEETFTITPDSGYNIADVEVDGASQGAVNTYTFTNVTGDHTINATFKAVETIDPTPGGGDHDDDDDYTLYYHSNFGSDKRFYQTQSSSAMKVRDYGDMKQLPVRDGYEFLCWNTEKDGSGRDYAPGDIYRVSASNSHLYAQWVKTGLTPDDTGVSRWLNTHDHMAYLSGYTDGNFGPDDNMTRAQVAQMFYRLLLEKDVPVTVQFSDVPADAWYATAVNTLASLGIVNGIGDHQFAPERQITRAEFTVIAMRFGRLDTSGSNIFTDVKADDWFYDQVVGAIKYGWIGGYADGTFRPNNTITRAEVTVIVNRMLGRAADTDFMAAHADELRKFSDVPASYWAYDQIMEATNAHEYRSSSGGEKWTGLVN